MDIVVCVKAVCASPVKFALSSAGDRVDCGSRSLTLNEVDEYALDAALVLRQKLGGSVTVVTAGPLASQDVLYVSRAKGADRGIRVDADLADPLAVSDVLARAIRSVRYDLVLAGVESSDGMSGATGIYTAERLGLPFAYAVTGIEVTPDPAVIRVTKELGGGSSQLLEIALPALLCVQSGIQPLTYAPVAKLMRVRREPLVSISPDEMDLAEDELSKQRSVSLVELASPQRTRQAVIFKGDMRQVAAAIVRKVREAS